MVLSPGSYGRGSSKHRAVPRRRPWLAVKSRFPRENRGDGDGADAQGGGGAAVHRWIPDDPHRARRRLPARRAGHPPSGTAAWTRGRRQDRRYGCLYRGAGDRICGAAACTAVPVTGSAVRRPVPRCRRPDLRTGHRTRGTAARTAARGTGRRGTAARTAAWGTERAVRLHAPRSWRPDAQCGYRTRGPDGRHGHAKPKPSREA